MLVVNASNIEKDLGWIKKQNLKFGANIYDISNKFSLLAVQGPNAIKMIQNLTTENLFSLNSFEHMYSNFAGYKDVIISRTGTPVLMDLKFISTPNIQMIYGIQ